MSNDRDLLAEYRLLEFPNETAQSWPIAGRERDGLPMRLLQAARDAGRRVGGEKNAA